jgi:hypothetical protein
MAVDIEATLHDLGVQIDRLKTLYEQYFIGLEKTAPNVARREVEKLLDFLGKQNIGNTGIRFRYLGLVRRWKTYTERWDKILREIENGTYARHLARARRRFGDAEGGRPPEPERAAATANGHAAPEVPGMSHAELRALHESYVKALRSVGDGREVRYETLLASLKKQVPAILEKNQQAQGVSFSVAVKDGKVVLRARARKDEEKGAPTEPTSS